MEGKCRFDASPFSVSGMLYYIFFLFLRQRIAILPFDYVISLVTNKLRVWQISVSHRYLPYIAIKTAKDRRFRGIFGVKTKKALSKNPFFRFNAWLFHLFFCNLTDDIEEITSRRSI